MKKIVYTITSLFFIAMNLYAASPNITSTPITSIDEDNEYIYTLDANDTDGDDLNWSIKTGTTLPSWLTLDNSGSWDIVGDAAPSPAAVTSPFIAMDSNNTLYIVYQDIQNSRKASVMKFNGTSWVQVGDAAFSPSTAQHTFIALDSNDTPYVAYRDQGNSQKASVMKFNGISWEQVGNAGFSAGQADYTAIAFDSNNTPYVVYQDYGNSQKASVMKFNGTAWEQVGKAGFTEYITDTFSIKGSSYTSIAFDSNDTPYVAYKDGANSYKASMMKFNGTFWEQVGNAGFSAEQADFISMAIDNNTPYVVYRDSKNSGKATTMKFNGTSWEQVGNVGFSGGEVNYTFISFDKTSTPYVSYQDYANTEKASVMKFNGTSWEQVGNAGFSMGNADYTNIALDSNNTPYVTFRDAGNFYKASVMKLTPKTILKGTPTNDNVGDHNITLVLSDGNTSVEHNFTITVNNTNDIPTASDINFTIQEDTNKTFSSDDFNYSDIDTGDSLEAIYITSLPTKGSLKLNDTNISLNQQLNNADISNLKFIPLTNEFGTPYSTFNFIVNDGESNSSNEYTTTINVTPINDIPSITSTPITSISEDSNYSYTLSLSGKDIEGDELTWSVKDGTTLPSWLTLNSGGSWEIVGDAGLSPDSITNPFIAINSNNTPYVAYKDKKNSYKASVMKFVGTSWVQVGNAGFTPDTAQNTSLVFDSNNTPYIAYLDSQKTNVMKFDGTSWVEVGNAGFSAGQADYISIAIDSNNTPYVTYQDIGNSYKASVMKFDGTSWVQVGDAGFTDTSFSGLSIKGSRYTSIALDSNNTPYVAYRDGANSLKASVMKFDGTSWVQVGTAGFSAGQADYTTIALDSKDTPYVVYRDSSNSGKASMMKFNGTSWVQVGDAGFSGGEANYTFIRFDKTNTPYIVYVDYGNAGKASVMKFNGTSWEQVGDAGFSAGQADYTTITLDSNNNPYVAYRDAANDYKASVMKFDSKTTLSGTPINDNVGDHNITLVLSDGNTSVEQNFIITVNNTNDTPTASDINFTIQEDTNKTFSANDFNYSDVDDGDSLEAIYIKTLPTKGSLKLNDTNVSLNQQISTVDIPNLKFIPIANEYGTPYSTFNFIVNDGESNSSVYTASINITAVNDIPNITSSPTISINQNSEYSYAFNAIDIEGADLNWSIKTGTTLPSWLKLESSLTATRSSNVFYFDTDNNAWENYIRLKNPNIEPQNRYYDEITLNDGSRYYADVQHHVIRKDINGTEIIFAGKLGENGSIDAMRTDARFNEPSGIAVDSSGNFYVTEFENHTIRKITPNGEVSLYAGAFGESGSNNGNALSARFNHPYGIAIDKNDNIYISDSGNHTIRKITKSGEVSLYAGIVGDFGNTNGNALNSKFNKPTGLALDDNGSLYIADKLNHVIRKIDINGNVSDYFGVSGEKDDSNSPSFEKLAYPFDVTFAKSSSSPKITTTRTDCVNFDPSKSCKDYNIVENYRPKSINFKIWEEDTVNSPIQMNTGSLSSLLAGFSTKYGEDAETYLDMNITNSDFQYNKNLDYDLFYNAKLYVRKAGTNNDKILENFELATEFSGVLSLVAKLDDNTTSLENGYGQTTGFKNGTGDKGDIIVSNLEIDSLIVKTSNIGVIRSSSLKFKLNLFSPSIVNTLNDNNISWMIGNDHLLKHDKSLDTYSGDKQLFIQDNSQYNIKRVESVVKVLKGTPTNNDVGDHNITLVVSDGNTNVEQNFTITVNNINDAPTSSNISFTIEEDTNKTFSTNDFNFSDVDEGDSLEAIYITSLPSKGSLKLNDTNISLNQKISTVDISNLKFIPIANEYGTPYSNFKFKVNDGESDSLEYTATVNINSINDTPSITSNALKSVDEDSEYAYILSSTDIDGDDLNWNVKMGTSLPSWLSLASGSVVSTLAGSGSRGSDNGNGITASFKYPNDLTIDSNGNIYVADTFNHLIRKITPSGNVTTFAGNGDRALTNQNGTSASFNSPYGITIDSSGNIYVADSDNNSIRKITPSGDVSTLAGSGRKGPNNGNGTNASFNYPNDVAIDNSGNIYVADTFNQLIRKITPSGDVTTLAGNGSTGSNNGNGANASFNYPHGITTDSNGNIYVADTFNHLIRKITPSGDVTTFAGNGTQGSDNGNGTNSSFNYPFRLEADSSGNIYLPDTDNHLIRKITPSGEVTTFAGNGNLGADNGTSASFNSPRGITIDSSGNVYVADTSNQLIRKISLNTILKGTPRNDDVGNHNITLVLSDGNISVEQNFIIIVSNTNDMPVINTNLKDLIINEDSPKQSLDLNISDMDGDNLSLNITSSNPNLLKVTSNWSDYINQATWNDTLNFYITPIPNANGVTTITLTLKDENNTSAISKSFDVNITALNDAPILSIQDLAVFKNSSAKSIPIIVGDVDNELSDLNFTVVPSQTGYIDNISFSGNIMNIKPISGVSGNTDINVTVSDGDLNVSDTFTYIISPLEADTGITQTPTVTKENKKTTTKVTIGDTNVETQEDESSGNTSHIINIGGTNTKATSKINGTKVKITSDGVQTSYSDSKISVEVNATTLGKATHKIRTSDGAVTQASSEIIGAQTIIGTDNEGEIEIVTSVDVDSSNIQVTAKADGSASHKVTKGSISTNATASIAGATTTITSDGNVETKAGSISSGSNTLQAKVVTDSNGASITKFILVDSDGNEKDLGNTLKSGTSFPSGNSVEIYNSGSKILMKTTVIMTDNLVVE